jgi:hypothetical protein
MQEKNEIFAENALSNIFNGALICITKAQVNQLQNYKVIGYRLESNQVENVRVASRQPEDERGVYRATVNFSGVRRRSRNRDAGFFPRGWTKEKVIEAIFEAYQNKAVLEDSQKEYIGKTFDGLNIVLWLDADGKILDAMPSIDTAIRPARRRKPKRTCKICGQIKHSVCLEHNQYKKKMPYSFARKIRYYFRKFYFNVGRSLGLVN